MIPTDLLETSFLGNTLSVWLQAIGIFLGVALVLWGLRHLVRRRFRRLSESTQMVVDDIVVAVLDRTRPIFLVLVAAWAGSRVLTIASGLDRVLISVAVIIVLLQVGLWLTTALVRWLDVVRKREEGEGETLTWLTGIEWAGKVTIWTVIVLIGLENLGVDVTGLVTGLGIGGVAVALAAQKILGDLFSAFAIFIDKPFVLGDSLVVGDFTGTVEDIGFKTTRLRSLSGEQLVFSNSDLLSSRIQNFGRLIERRVSFTVGVTYDTPREKVEKLPGIIKESVESQENVRFDRSHFKELGDSALTVESVYHVLVPSYQSYMDIQQAVNLELMRRFEAEGIEFAYPTQTILLGQGEGPELFSEPSSHT